MKEMKKDVRIKKKKSKVPPVKLPQSLEMRQELILQSITFDYSSMIFVWNSSTHFPIDFAIQMLSAYGAVTNVQYRWPVSESNRSNLQYGALVEFAQKADVEKALKEFPYQNM